MLLKLYATMSLVLVLHSAQTTPDAFQHILKLVNDMNTKTNMLKSDMKTRSSEIDSSQLAPSSNPAVTTIAAVSSTISSTPTVPLNTVSTTSTIAPTTPVTITSIISTTIPYTTTVPFKTPYITSITAHPTTVTTNFTVLSTTTSPSSTVSIALAVPSTTMTFSTTTTGTQGFEECSDVYAAGQTSAGKYVIKAYANRKLSVWCDKGWTSIQRRKYADVSFDRPWAEYVSGFGDVSRDFWSGLDAMHSLTHDQQHRLRVEFFLDDNIIVKFPVAKNDGNGTMKRIDWALFSVGPGDSYRLAVRGMTTTMVENAGVATYMERYHNGSSFSARDKDQDTRSDNCAQKYSSGWWHMSRCFLINFNVNSGGCSSDNKICANLFNYHAKSVEMKIRR